MREKRELNQGWKFINEDIKMPDKLVRKAGCLGGYTSTLEDEKGEVVLVGEGGKHFLNIISNHHQKEGLMMLAGTQYDVNLKGWKEVTVPHDWKVHLPYTNKPELLMSGFKKKGIGYYRQTFRLEECLKDKEMTIHFEGVSHMASVWFNGCFLGDHYGGYTSFSFNLSDMARFGEEDNVLLVKVDATIGNEGWWYDGAGIYRNVYLHMTDTVSINEQEVYVYTKSIENKKACLVIEIPIINNGYTSEEVSLMIEVLNKQIECEKVIVEPLKTVVCKKEIEIEDVQLWSIENPYLYKITCKLFNNHIEIDKTSIKTGIRQMAYTTEGLFINGEHIEIKGVCEHQDFVGVGTASTKDIIRYKLERLKQMGGNAYRSAHHPASPDLLDLCDELGIIVMDENRILESSKFRLQEVRDMVIRDRNHPCILFWSIANEEVIGSTSLAVRMAKRIATTIRQLDATRLLVSAELLNPEGIINEEYMKIFDIVGVNYPEAGVMGDGLNKMKIKYPNQPFMSTENASYFSTRGIYEDNWELSHTNNFGSCFNMFSKEPMPQDMPGAGGTAHPERVLDYYKEHPFMGGSFIWTLMDYYGEPSPFEWPAISSQFGILDVCGLPKDYFYYYQSKWTKEPMIHMMPHWNLKDGKTNVRVFSNCEEIELWINHISQGKKKRERHHTNWEVDYVPGQIEVVGYNDGQIVVRQLKKTSQEASDVKVIGMNDRNYWQQGDTALFEVIAIDKEGIEVPTSNNEVDIHIKEGQLLGVGNGNPQNHTPVTSLRQSLFSGKLVIVMLCIKDKKPEIEVNLIHD